MAYENFLADWTEEDPTEDIVLTSTKTEWTNLPHTADSYVWCDKGANFFSGAYKHQFEISYTHAAPDVQTYYWMLTKTAYHEALFYDLTDGLVLQRNNDGDFLEDNWLGFAKDVTYYVTMRRTAGGTLTAEIRTGSHTGVLQDTLQITGATQAYAQMTAYYNGGAIIQAYASGFTQNLDLTAGQKLLAGTVAIASTATGEVSRDRYLAGTVAIESTTSGAIKVIRGISRTTTSRSWVVGELSKKLVKPLAGIVAIESTVTGAITRIKGLAGTCAIASTTAGQIKATREIAGVVAIESTVTGELVSPTRELAGVVAIESTAIGELTRVAVKELAGTCAIESTTAGELKATRELAGTVVIESATTGVIKATRGLIGTVTITSTTASVLSTTRKLVGVVTIESIVIGELTRIGTKLLAGTVTISSTVIGELTTPGEKLLAGTVAIKSTVTGILIVYYAYRLLPPFMQKDVIDPYSGGAWLWLIEITVPGYSVVRRARNPVDIRYGGEDFAHGNFVPARIPLASDGSIPRIQVRVAQEKILEDIVNASKGCENGTIKIIRTCEKFLESPAAALQQMFSILSAGSDYQWITFILGIPSPLTQRLPLWLYNSKVCPLATPSLFKGPRCQYAGEDTVCTGLLSDCYTKGNAEHWGGEAGLDPSAVRI